MGARFVVRLGNIMTQANGLIRSALGVDDQTPEAEWAEVVAVVDADDVVVEIESKPGERPTICAMCGELFVAPRSDAKTCSAKCRQRISRKRRAMQ